MSKIIVLAMYPVNYSIAFETTGIEIIATAQADTSRAIVNGVEVYESFSEVLWLVQENKS